MADKNVRIGFVGAGGMGQCAHLRNYVTLPDCKVVALAELRPGLAKRVAEKYGVPRVYPNAEEMLAHEKLDGIVAVQMFTFNGSLYPGLYQAGVPVLSEKPLAASVEVGERLVQALRQSGTWQMVAYHKRSDPAIMHAKQEIERLKKTGELGRMRYVRLVMPPGDWTANGFFDLVNTDEPMPSLAEDPPPGDMDAEGYKLYVSFVNYYIHQVNLMRHLLGEPYQVTFADRSGVVLAVESASGVTGVIEMCTFRTTVDWQESCLVTFERGHVKVDLPAPMVINRPGRVQVYTDPGSGVTPMLSEPQLPWVHAHRQQAINFVRAIQGKIEPLCEAAEALEDLKVARDYLRLWKGI